MLTKWLTYERRPNSPFKFEVVDSTEVITPDEEIKDWLANILLEAYENPVMIRNECQILLEGVTENKLDILRQYVEGKILPSGKNMVITRIGNFGEVLSANALVRFEGFSIPIYKLRYREKKDWAVRLTDLCLIKNVDIQKPLVSYGEVKTISADHPDRDIAIQGHNSLAKDDALTDPEILRFICTWLYEKEMYDEAKLFSGIRLGKIDYDKRHDLFLVHTSETWNEEVLETLQIAELDPRLVNFSVKVLLISNLRCLIDEVYERCGTAVEAIANE